MRRLVLRLAFSLACAAVVAASASSCLIADPSAGIPQSPNLPPTIPRADVSPPITTVLTVWPDSFFIPVTRVNQTTPSYAWAAFIDYDATNPPERPDLNGTSHPPAPSITIDLTQPTLGGCHVIEVIVANTFVGSSFAAAHTPDTPGGDSVVWFYSPGGDLAGCPAYTGAADASFPDTGADGGDAGTE